MSAIRFRLELRFLFFLLVVLGILLLAPRAGGAAVHPLVEPHEEPGGATPAEPQAARGYTPCSGGFAGPYPCEGVDLLSFLPNAEIGGGNAADLWGWTDPETGREYALIAKAAGAAFIDVTVPEDPVYLGFLGTQTTSSGNRDVRVYGHYAFIVADSVGPHGMQVFDLRQLRGPGGQATSPQLFTATARFAGVDTVHNIDVNGETGFAYLVGSNLCQGALLMVDVRDPLNPRSAGCHVGSGAPYIHDVQCVIYRGPDRRYRGRELCLASNVDALAIVDVTDKSAPREIARKRYQGAVFSHQGWLTEDHRYFLMDDELDERSSGHNTRTYLWDVSNLEDPVHFATHEHPSTAIDHDLYIKGNFVYQGNYRAGLRILELAGLKAGKLREVAFFDIVPENDAPVFSGAWGAYPFFDSGTILVSGMEQGLFVLRRTAGGLKPGTPCKPGRETLCLAGKRFQVEVDWRNPVDGSRGRARVAAGGKSSGNRGEAGFFSFGDPANLELAVKLVNDGSHYFLYYGPLTNLGITIRVTDRETGRVRTAGNGAGNCGGILELAPSDGHGHDTGALALAEPMDLAAAAGPARARGACGAGSSDKLCLGGRYRVGVSWRNPFDGASGQGRPKTLSAIAGSFAFADPRSPELLVKVLEDGGRTLVLWGALSNLEYTLEVTDTKTGRARTFHNPPGRYCGGAEEL